MKQIHLIQPVKPLNLILATIILAAFADYFDASKMMRLRCLYASAFSAKLQSNSRITAPPPQKATTARTATTTTYFTCRHTFEKTLMDELQLALPVNIDSIWRKTHLQSSATRGLSLPCSVSSPFPGLVKAEYDTDGERCSYLQDPVYALQILPNAIEVCGKSTKELTKNAVSALSLDNIAIDQTNSNNIIAKELLASSRETLTLHAILPDMLKGSPRPKMQLRMQNIAKETSKILQAVYPCTRKRVVAQDVEHNTSSGRSESHQMDWILQLLLLSPENLVASLSTINHCTLNNNADIHINMSWPCVALTAGLANAEEHVFDLFLSTAEEKKDGKLSLGPAPSSAYRKLIEALSCMGMGNMPHGSTAIDLGASPGGWTSVLRKIGFEVTAVDRAALDKELMNDKGVTFISGDAFAYTPSNNISPVTLMVSDIIAFPERVAELLEKWCSLNLANAMVVTMKFTGETPAWDELRKAREIATRNGYVFRAKHFFNNKNEVTLMLVKANLQKQSSRPNDSPRTRKLDSFCNFQTRSMYEVILPKRFYSSKQRCNT